MTPDQPPIYIHVGLGKAASTYLQKRVFPRFRGIHYVHRNRYASAPAVIDAGGHGRYLVSREFGRNFAARVRDFADRYPWATPIIILRRHDSWAASQYRRYVKNGGPLDFDEFIDLNHDRGEWSQADLSYFARIELLERSFGQRPVVLFYADLQRDPIDFIRRFAAVVGAEVDTRSLSLAATHRSYDDRQLLLLRAVNRKLGRTGSLPDGRSERHRWWRRRLAMFGSYLVLYPSRLLPAGITPEPGPLVPPASLERIRQHYQSDWECCIAYACASPPLPDHARAA